MHKIEIQTIIISQLNIKAQRLDRSMYKLANGNFIFFRTSKAHSSGRRLLYWFGFHKDRIAEYDQEKLFLLFVCGSENQVIILPASFIKEILKDVPTATDDNWKIKIYKDNNDFELNVTSRPSLNINQFLNKYDLIEGRSERIEPVDERQIPIEDEIMNLDGVSGNSLHDKLIDMVRQIGVWMGYESTREYKIRPDVPYFLDVAWINNGAIHIAIEVQIGGNITEAKDRLILAKRFGARKCVIISNPDSVDRIKSVFKYEADIKHWIEIWGLERIHSMFVDGRSFFENYSEFNRHQYRDDAVEIT